MNIAVITGASSGLGKVFFGKVIERYPKLDEIWIIARRESKLKELASQYPDRKIRVLPLDLSDTKSIETLDDILKEQHPDIKVLINNAGFDRAGLFREMSQKDIYSLIDLNVTGTTMISRSCLPYMHEGSYQIITGSIGSFAPLPWRAVYSATKAEKDCATYTPMLFYKVYRLIAKLVPSAIMVKFTSVESSVVK